MKIVIDIPEGLKKDFELEQWTALSCMEMKDALMNGTPLPKGHGRLIDADYLREDFKASKKISFAERMDISCIVDHAPTIIEADGEVQDADSD